MTDNRGTREAREVCGRSEFLKRVEDFATYMQKEYIDCSNDRGLMISAGDRKLNADGTGAMAHILLGSREVNTATLVSMMRQEAFGVMVRAARLANLEDGDDAARVATARRRSLRVDYVTAAALSLWTLCVAVMGIAGWMQWTLAVTNIALLAFSHLVVWRDIRLLRRKIWRLEEDAREARREKDRRLENDVRSFLETLRNSLDEDDD